MWIGRVVGIVTSIRFFADDGTTEEATPECFVFITTETNRIWINEAGALQCDDSLGQATDGLIAWAPLPDPSEALSWAPAVPEDSNPAP